jgi:hypothetical protein
LSENPHKLNSQRATNRPRRLLPKKEGRGRKTVGMGQKWKKQRGKEGRNDRKEEERRHQD